MKKFIIAIIALSATMVVAAQTKQYNFQKGDTVYVLRSATHFLTGEHIAPWVYDDVQVIKKTGCKRFPDGFMLMPVHSWLSAEAIGAKEITPAPAPQEEVLEQLPAVPTDPAPAAEPEPVVAPEPAPEPVVAEEAQDPFMDLENAQTPKNNQHRFGIGIRLGGATFLQKTQGSMLVWNGNRHWGGMAGLDLEYAFYGRVKTNPTISLGLRTGVSAVYSHSMLRASDMVDQYMVADDETPVNNIRYTVAATDVFENNSQVLVEVPLLFALRTDGGFVFATGPKVNFPLLGWYKTTYKNADIRAYYTELGVVEPNEVVTGKLDGVAPQTDNKLRMPMLNFLWNMELGYEWKLKNADAIALTVFGDYPILYYNYEEGTSATHFIQVGKPKAGGPTIETNSIMNCYGKQMTYLDFGIKVTYNFCFDGKK